MVAASGYIAGDWLRASRLPIAEVQTAVQLMAIIIAMRWLCGLYRGVVSGSERLVWLGGYNAMISTLRFVAVLPVLMFIGVTPTIFFGFQLGVAVIELAALLFYAYRLLPGIPEGQRLPLDWSPLKPVLKFSLTVAFTSSVMVLVTQTDKLVLSTFLPLEEYGYFTLAVLVASGVIVITSPISVALLPRMTKLNAEKDDLAMIRLYRNATQLVSVIAIPTTLVLAFFAEQVLWAWTGDSEIARKTASVLTLYALGNGFFTLAAFGYYLQFAKGDLKLHVLGNLLFAAIFVPLLLWAVREYGMIGAGYAWLVANLLPFTFWLPIVHRRFFKALHSKWLLHDVMPILVVPTGIAFLFRGLVSWPKTQSMVAVCIVAVGVALCAIAILCSSWCRGTLRDTWRAKLVV
jgi:O-antigen/teichoic acid export membrane protein